MAIVTYNPGEVKYLAGLAADTPPTTNTPVGSSFFETDTGITYFFDGTDWVPKEDTIAGAVSITGALPGGTNNIGDVDVLTLPSVRGREIVAVSSTMTRTAATDPYSANDAVSNSITDGSVTSPTVTVSDVNNEPVVIERLRVATTDTGFAAGIRIRVWLFASDPTASSGIVGADNEAFSVKHGATFIGTMSGIFRAFSDGGHAILTPDEGSSIRTLPVAGAMTLRLLYQTLDAVTPSANSTTFIATLEGYQGKAA